MIETTIPKSWYTTAIRQRDEARNALVTMVSQVDMWATEAFRLADLAGWVAFGTHVERQDIELEFDGTDAAGEPLWEREALGGS